MPDLRLGPSRGGTAMNANTQPITIGQSEFHCPCHACAFFHSRDEEYELLLPFSNDSYAAGQRLFQVVDKEHREERRRRLSNSGIDLEKAESAGQLEIRVWEEAYLRGNRFDQDSMLELVESVLREGRDKGFPVTRFWANMEWALEDFPGVHDIVEYEARANKFLPQYPAFVVCTYDLNKFSAPVVMDIMRTHPQVIIGGILQENPFYVPPDEFLAELRHRPM
jgi:MEDS: MEthanogen/methylotroph, DcmR Sensory domain